MRTLSILFIYVCRAWFLQQEEFWQHSDFWWFLSICFFIQNHPDVSVVYVFVSLIPLQEKTLGWFVFHGPQWKTATRGAFWSGMWCWMRGWGLGGVSLLSFFTLDMHGWSVGWLDVWLGWVVFFLHFFKCDWFEVMVIETLRITHNL